MGDESKITGAVPAIPLTQGEQARISSLPETDELRTDLPPIERQPINWLQVADRKGLNQDQRDFVLKVGPAAEAKARELDLPPEGLLSQLALESGWGKSRLAAEYNNFGGIKATPTWKGDVVKLPSSEKDASTIEISPFRVYPSIDDYIKDYGELLSHPRYKGAKGTNDAYSYGLAITKAGYSADTPEKYADQLSSIAKRLGF